MNPTPSAPRPSRGKRPLAIALAVVILAVTAFMGWRYWGYFTSNPTSDDAQISADVVHISPGIPGVLQTLEVQEGSRVARGALLFTLDPHDYELRVRQARAEVDVAQAALDARERQMRAEQANADIAREQIHRAESNLELAQKTVSRLEPLAAKGYVPRQELDTAQTAARDAQVSLTQAYSQAEAAQELVGKLEAAQAAVEVAQASLALAEKALEDTRVQAPNNGLVVGLTVSAGERLAPGQALFTLINTDAWYATAFFRETDLPHIQVGDCASVYTMMAPQTTLHGKVASTGWGITSESAIQLPRAMPIVQKSLNWVRVAQRFPVRVRLESPPAELMRVGASATVVIRSGERC
ncbi:multidrug transporter subunit MdtN [Castellaniella sp.]|uniref:multidrug transporter subunit MdtN n=1 Tax=Castellaniella sp. TaxID=1955812 RepID=UPI0035657567